jgi:hypothetical protein
MTNQLDVTSLSKIVIPNKVIPITKTQGVKIYGLSVYDLLQVFENHLDLLDKALDGDIESIGKVLRDCPELLASVLIKAIKEPDTEELRATIAILPFPTQMNAVVEVFNLTFPDPEILKKFWAGLEGIIGQLNQVRKVALTEITGESS